MLVNSGNWKLTKKSRFIDSIPRVLYNRNVMIRQREGNGEIYGYKETGYF